MGKKSLTCQDILEFQMDEHKASKDYAEFDDPQVNYFANDEAKHGSYFDKLALERGCKK